MTAAVSLLSASLLVVDDKERNFLLSKDEISKVPIGWKADKTGKGEGSIWKVVAELEPAALSSEFNNVGPMAPEAI